jgi:hypothetical protein
LGERTRKPPSKRGKPKAARTPGGKPAGLESRGHEGLGPSPAGASGSGSSSSRQDLILALQRSAGNRAVNEMLGEPGAVKQPQQLLSPAGVAERLGPGHAGAVVQFNKKLSPRIKAMVAHFEGLGKAAKGPGMVAKGPGMAPKAPGKAAKGPGMVAKGPGMAPKGPGVAVKGPGMAPKVPGMAPKGPGMAPKGPGVAVKGPGMVPKVPGMAPKGPGKAAKVPGKAAKVPGKAPGKAPKKVISANIKNMIARMGAQQDHTKDVNRLQNDVMGPVRGKAPDPKKGVGDLNNLLINSVQWIDAGRSKLFALTKPHDWKARQKATGKAEVPYFPKPPGKDTAYDLDPAKGNDFFDWNSAGTLGYRSPDGTIAMMEPRNRPVADLQKTLIHEVQHDADFHTKMKQYHPGGLKTWKDYAERSLNRYMSEFRAYWTAQGADYGSPRRKRSQSPYRSERHKKIAQHIIGAYQYAWNCFNEKIEQPAGSGKFAKLDSRVSGKTFKRWVYSFSGPSGYNLANSVRIAALIEKLQVGALKPGTSKWTAEAKDVKAAAQALDALDKKCLRDPGSDVRRLIGTKLAGRVRRTIRSLTR